MNIYDYKCTVSTHTHDGMRDNSTGVFFYIFCVPYQRRISYINRQREWNMTSFGIVYILRPIFFF